MTGLVGLMGSLVGTWTQMLPPSSAEMAHQFGNLTDILVGSKTTSTRPLGRRARSSAAPASRKSPASADSEGGQPTDEHSRGTDHLGRDDSSPCPRRVLRSAAVAGSVKGVRSGGLDETDPTFSADDVEMADTSSDGDTVDGDARSDGDSGDDESSPDGDYVLAAREKITDSEEDDTGEPDHPLGDPTPPSHSEDLPLNSPASVDANDSPSHIANLDNIISSPVDNVDSDDSSIPEASACAVEVSSKDEGIPPVNKRKLRSVVQAHNSIAGLVVSELLEEGIDLVARSGVPVRSTSDNRTDLPAPKKMTPKRYIYHIFLFLIFL